MRGSALSVALCVLGAAHVASSASLKESKLRDRQFLDPVQHQGRAQPATGAPRQTRAAEHWLALISEIARLGALSELSHTTNSASVNTRTNNIYLPAPIKLEGNTTLQLVLIPVAVGTPQYQQSFHTDFAGPNIASTHSLTTSNVPPFSNRQPLVDVDITDRVTSQVKITNEDYGSQTSNFHHSTGTLQPPQAYEPSVFTGPQHRFSGDHQAHNSPVYSSVDPSTNSGASTSIVQPPQAVVYETSTLPAGSAPQLRLSVEERRARNSLIFLPVDDSQQLVQQFRAQLPRTPALPPVVIEPLVVNTADDEVVDVPDPTQEQQPNTNAHYVNPKETEKCRHTCQESFSDLPNRANSENMQPSPPLPRFERSIMIEAVLTVPSADYSEPYTIWWDAASGASRIEHHGGAATSYRIIRPDGRVQSVHVRVDRTGEADVRRCTVLEPRRITLAERALPVLPDLSGFTFAGYIEVKPMPEEVPSRVERWVQTVSAAPGAAGAVRGEELTHRHELLVARSADSLTTTPLRYAVVVDSSVLGTNCESYIHRFMKVYTRNHDSSTFSLDASDACDYIEKTNQLELVEPLREFALLQRDPKYDGALTRYKKLYNREYKDDTEEAVRKNVLIQTSRFASSGNRKGASFELEVNFMADRLREELNPLYGIDSSGGGGGDNFPHGKLELRRMSGRLPQKFDWRERGGVTHVRNQSTCASCWAFSVVGAVEGALFANTGRLVSLSEQSLVDCGHRSGAKGCGATWPRFAYDYIRDNGIPALDEYRPYVAKVQQCSVESVAPVTRISTHVNVTSRNLVALKVAIRRHGPTVVLVDGEASSLHLHKSGFYHDAKCKQNSSTHAMLAVGWTVHRGETYFILKNSWSAGWGEGGYIYMRGKTNTCGLLRLPSYPVLRRSDVLRVPSSAQTAPVAPAK